MPHLRLLNLSEKFQFELMYFHKNLEDEEKTLMVFIVGMNVILNLNFKIRELWNFWGRNQ